MNALDLKHFKKVSSDEHSTTFKHPSGHQIQIAHKAISKGIVGKLKELPGFSDGGIADPVYVDPDQAPRPEEMIQESNRSPASVMDTGRDIGNQMAKSTGIHEYGSEPAPYNNKSLMDSAQIPAATPDVSGMQANQALQKRAPAADQYGFNKLSGDIRSGMGQVAGGAKAFAGAEKQRGAEEATAAGQKITNSNMIMDVANHNLAQHNADMQNLVQQYSSGQIDPNRIFHNMSTGQHISTAIGLILGGMGGGLTHQENPALKFLEQQVNNDIYAQSQNLGIKKSLLDYNVGQFHDKQDAAKMTNVMMNQLTEGMLQKAAANARGPEEAARAMQAAGEVKLKYAPMLQELMMKKAMFGMMGNMGGQQSEDSFKQGTMAMRMFGNKDMADDMEKKHLSGVPGQASNEISPDDRKQWEHLGNLSKSYDDAQSYLNNVGKLGAGWLNANKARGTAIGKSLELEVGQLEGLGRFTPEEAKRYKDMIPDLGGTHFTGTDQAKLTQLKREVDNHKNTLLSGVGLKAPAKVQIPEGKPK